MARFKISAGTKSFIRIRPQTARKWLRQREPLEIPRAVELLLPLQTSAKVRRLVAELEAAEAS
ncbi:hypothetical protein [Bradyrhizobium japonicum]|uniref:hypothetical protein n=1 Tax=Bradyrhizobium japonicum TaxID=375 RepID=UPI002714D28B|nr:hypothetical protein [Bradyrhizobium japonicum]WLB14966.1 hypothetical protein QIH95_23125 [Bradyrhizobium japonicum]